ncbi:bifunctional glucose-1-phosphatase/inositol phosphatase [Kosakonia sp. H02]|nr:bifunctional glucose-1-phosphatase/inositol phosphatase [Kosakonia sp. H02]
MKRLFWLGALAASLVTPAALAQTAPEGYTLQQIVILSRHGIRAPLANTGSALVQSTDKPWPKWDVAGGELTERGGALEVFLAHNMRKWMENEKVLSTEACPTPTQFYAWANSLQRTYNTARYFIANTFVACDVPIYHQREMGNMDPLFNPVITDNSAEFRQKAVNAMEAQRQKYDFDESYKLLESIVDYRHSPACKEKPSCSLSQEKDTFSANYRLEPNVSGPLKTANALVDAFTLQYYQGLPREQVAWGGIKSDKQWQLLEKLKNGYQDILFTTPGVARNVAKPLLQYFNRQLVEKATSAAKITLLVGHDSNIASLLAALDAKPWQLPGQFERTPISGKVVFQRWHDTQGNRDLMKIEYFYFTAEQMRNLDKMGFDTPVQRYTLELKGCPVDSNGFCPMQKFSALLGEAAK